MATRCLPAVFHLLVLSLVSLVLAGSARAEAEGWRMDDLGGSVHLPKGLDPIEGGWGDDELTAKSEEGVLFKLWLTRYQVPISEDTLTEWSTDYLRRLAVTSLEKGKVTSTEVSEIGGRRTGLVNLSFRIDSGGAGYGTVASFQGAGHVVHVRVLSNARRASLAQGWLRSILSEMELDDGPMPIEGPGVETDAGFAATLPEGWRKPLRPEMEAVRKITARLGEEKLAQDDCWVAIQPHPVGDPDVIFTCNAHHYLGPVDEYSFAGVETQVRERFFGSTAGDVPPAESVTIGDRMGFFYRPPKPIRLAIAPYSGGVMTAWGMAAGEDATVLDTAMMEILPGVQFTGPGGGQPIIGLDKRVGYYLSYRTTSPIVLGPLIVIIGLVGFLVVSTRRRTAARWDDMD